MTSKRILIGVDDELLAEVDVLAAQMSISRSEFIRRAMKRYAIEQHRMNVRERMKKGYQEMAKINSEWADFALLSDEAVHLAYEKTMG